MMRQPAFSHLNRFAHGNSTPGLPCYVENVFELLGDEEHGRPGDYYLDLDQNVIYYVSPDEPVSAILPQSLGLLELNNVSDVSISGVSFKEDTWSLSSSGYIQWQAGGTEFLFACLPVC